MIIYLYKKDRDDMSKEEFLVRILVCFGLSFMVGIERQYRRRSVGLRTTILVSLGAFLFVSFSFYVNAYDMSRVASSVVAGIGFLGTGVIIKDGVNVRGLTTAATLWCDCAVGILCTGGFFFEATLGTLLILFSNIILRFINQKLRVRKNGKAYYQYSLNMVFKGDRKVIGNLNEYMLDEDVVVDNMDISKMDDCSYRINAVFLLPNDKNKIVDDIMQKFSLNKYVVSLNIRKEDLRPELDVEEL